MKMLNLQDILKPMNGMLVRGDANLMIKDAVTQADQIKKNTIYFHFHDNVIDWQSIPLHDSVVLITEKYTSIDPRVIRVVTIVEVENIERAYWSFVQFYRDLFHLPVIGVTGTCGKTTTTEMIKHILSQRYHVQSTYDGRNRLSFNLPYLLGIDESTEAAVFEMGVSHPGCIWNSCRHFQPKVGVLLNIGVYHLLGCGTLENYINAKAEIVDGLAPDGTLILNADDENIKKIDISRFKGNVVFIGKSQESHYRARDIVYTNGGMKFTLDYDKQVYPLFVPGYGEHNVYNALAAIASTHAIGMTIEEAGDGLATFQHVRKHLEFRTGIRGCTIIDDTWNCTPPSIEAALRVLEEMADGKKKIAVLGYMPQLGENAMNEYDKIGIKVMETGIDHLILIGEAARIGIKAIRLGMDKRRVYFCDTAQEVYNALVPLLDKDSLVLFKFPYKYRLSQNRSFRKFMDITIQ